MEKTEKYDGLARCLCAAYKAYIGGVGIDYMLKTYIQKQNPLPPFWLDVAEAIVGAMTGRQNTDPDKVIDLRPAKSQEYDLKPLNSMTNNEIEKLVETLPEGCDICGNPPSEMVTWLLLELRDLLPPAYAPTKGLIQ